MATGAGKLKKKKQHIGTIWNEKASSRRNFFTNKKISYYNGFDCHHILNNWTLFNNWTLLNYWRKSNLQLRHWAIEKFNLMHGNMNYWIIELLKLCLKHWTIEQLIFLYWVIELLNYCSSMVQQSSILNSRIELCPQGIAGCRAVLSPPNSDVPDMV